MTKKEQAAFDALRQELRLARALRFTEPVERDVAPPVGYKEDLSVGWSEVGAGQWGRVEPACSSCINHAIGRTDKTTTQYPIWLHSTKLRALKALRHQTEMECARMLAQIDVQIEAEQSKEKEGDTK